MFDLKMITLSCITLGSAAKNVQTKSHESFSLKLLFLFVFGRRRAVGPVRTREFKDLVDAGVLCGSRSGETV